MVCGSSSSRPSIHRSTILQFCKRCCSLSDLPLHECHGHVRPVVAERIVPSGEHREHTAEQRCVQVGYAGWFPVQGGRNTQRSLDLGRDGAVQYIRDIRRFFIVADFNLNKSEESALANTGFQHIKYLGFWCEPIYYKSHEQLQYNGPRRIDVRWVTGAGSRWCSRSTYSNWISHLSARSLFQINAFG